MEHGAEFVRHVDQNNVTNEPKVWWKWIACHQPLPLSLPLPGRARPVRTRTRARFLTRQKLKKQSVCRCMQISALKSMFCCQIARTVWTSQQPISISSSAFPFLSFLILSKSNLAIFTSGSISRPFDTICHCLPFLFSLFRFVSNTVFFDHLWFSFDFLGLDHF